jgi:hypothetical protein
VTPIFTFKKSKNQLRKFTPLSTSLCILLWRCMKINVLRDKATSYFTILMK